MTAVKTRETGASVQDFIDRVPGEQRRRDARQLLRLMRRVTRQQPRMWGPSIVGFGKHHYRYASGRAGEICMIGFSPRSQALTLYVMSGGKGHGELLKKLGRYKTSKACLYIKRLDDVDLAVLEKIIRSAYRHARSRNQGQ
jgi:hypothetical protein